MNPPPQFSSQLQNTNTVPAPFSGGVLFWRWFLVLSAALNLFFALGGFGLAASNGSGLVLLGALLSSTTLLLSMVTLSKFRARARATRDLMQGYLWVNLAALLLAFAPVGFVAVMLLAVPAGIWAAVWSWWWEKSPLVRGTFFN